MGIRNDFGKFWTSEFEKKLSRLLHGCSVSSILDGKAVGTSIFHSPASPERIAILSSQGMFMDMIWQSSKNMDNGFFFLEI